MPKTLTREEAQQDKLVGTYNKTSKQKGPLEEWTDSLVLKTRDKFRILAKKTRGLWTFDFYESLQALNKESIKRDLDPETK